MSHNSLMLRTRHCQRRLKGPKITSALTEHLTSSKYYTSINELFKELISGRKMFIAFSEHMHWVYARDPLKDPVELAGATVSYTH